MGAGIEPRLVAARKRLQRLRQKAGGAAAHNRRWNSANREKYLAHKAVENALKAGKLKRLPCAVCGQSKAVHAHHDDYENRLDVVWLCPRHHKQRHAERDAAASRGAFGEALPELDTPADFTLRRRGFCPGHCRTRGFYPGHCRTWGFCHHITHRTHTHHGHHAMAALCPCHGNTAP